MDETLRAMAEQGEPGSARLGTVKGPHTKLRDARTCTRTHIPKGWVQVMTIIKSKHRAELRTMFRFSVHVQWCSEMMSMFKLPKVCEGFCKTFRHLTADQNSMPAREIPSDSLKAPDMTRDLPLLLLSKTSSFSYTTRTRTQPWSSVSRPMVVLETKAQLLH